jgi:hypothetical protein
MSVLQIPAQDTIRHIRRIQTITICWMIVEATASLAAAWMARSPALLAFGGDSAIELLSAILVLWRFRAHAAQEQSENLAARICWRGFSNDTFGAQRTQNHVPGDSYPDRGSRNHALACQGKAQTLRNHG